MTRRGEGRGARLRHWLTPGVGLKRWLLIVFLGELFLAYAGSLVLRALYRDLEPGGPEASLISVVTLSFLPLPLRALGLLVVGGGIFLYGFWRLLDTLLEPFPDRDEPIVELLYHKRSLARGPRIVAIGGGTGLSTLLRGLKEVTSNITAVVAVADDGGSSGKLRAEMGLPPVGDIRNCIAALADAEPTMTRLLQYRFPAVAPEGAALSGHSLGNLLIAALTAIEEDFEEGVRQTNRVLAVRGRVVPAAPVPLTLHAELVGGERLEGQSTIARAQGIDRVWITPDRVRASQDALEAIASADLVVIGPGSLYTSLLPSLLVPDLRAAVAASPARRVYVCNVATQIGETEGYTLGDHLAALDRHGVGDLVDIVLANDNFTARAPANYPAAPVGLDRPAGAGRPRVVLADVVDADNAHRHEPAKLAAAILRLEEEPAPERRPVRVARPA